MKLISENQSRETGTSITSAIVFLVASGVTNAESASQCLNERATFRPSNLSVCLPSSLAMGRALPHNAHLWHRSCRDPRCFPMDLAHHIRSSTTLGSPSGGRSPPSYPWNFVLQSSANFFPLRRAGLKRYAWTSRVRVSISEEDDPVKTGPPIVIARVVNYFRGREKTVMVSVAAVTDRKFVKCASVSIKKKGIRHSRNSLFEKVISHLVVKRLQRRRTYFAQALTTIDRLMDRPIGERSRKSMIL